jgi:hypothetical protein
MRTPLGVRATADPTYQVAVLAGKVGPPPRGAEGTVCVCFSASRCSR